MNRITKSSQNSNVWQRLWGASKSEREKTYRNILHMRQIKSSRSTTSSPGKTENIQNFTEKKLKPRYIITKRNSHQELPWQFVAWQHALCKWCLTWNDYICPQNSGATPEMSGNSSSGFHKSGPKNVFSQTVVYPQKVLCKKPVTSDCGLSWINLST